MTDLLAGKTILVTGAARRLGRLFALTCAHHGANVVIHHAHSEEDAESVRAEIVGLGCQAWIFQPELSDSSAAENLIPFVNESTPLHGLVNGAAIFRSQTLDTTSLDDWQKTLSSQSNRAFSFEPGCDLATSDGNKNPDLIKNVPSKRWANLNEVEDALLFLLTCPAYLTGEIIHLDGGRHLV